MENNEELKPCPFCGGRGLVQIAPDVRGLKKCPHCGGNGRVCVSSKPETMEKWFEEAKKVIKWVAISESGGVYGYSVRPALKGNAWWCKELNVRLGVIPNYKGDWKRSLRKVK